MIFLVVTLFLQGQPPVTLERSLQPDIFTCFAKSKDAIERGRAVARAIENSGYELKVACEVEEDV